MELAYYPGCSLEASAKEYNLSALAVSMALGLRLKELDDWACCGATSAHSTNHMLSLALPARNLAIAQEGGLDITIPCAACYSRHKKADYVLRHDQQKRSELEDIVNFKYQGNIKVLSLLETYYDKVGLKAIAGKVVKPLTGLKLACYYGCLLVRPPEITGFDNPENPVSLDQIMSAIGAQPVKWSYKTDCCGANLSATSSSTVTPLVTRIINMAVEAGAQAIVTACPLCQLNLEVRRDNCADIPVFYFTELLGLAMELPGSDKWLIKHFIDPMPLLRSLKLMA
ncbi:MAG: CoB--CoM heterodisulfide reductase iron-sulfur subunit B family protein [Desulfurispora sp.]|uniref:CoB--CoM heterodisulfide reductase iron-sulfur subunit B family protein n=1 Tax=Desulfurispora sp. TaxID=3014275 RepID=UPI00404AAC0E